MPATWRRESLSGAALRILEEEGRRFFTSQMVRLELLPKARFEKRMAEVAFYEAHFAECIGCEPLSESLGREAESLAGRYGLAGADAMQIAPALRHEVAEFYTSEKPGKPLFRVKEWKVISLFSPLN